jgi:hypothetical protein
LLEGLTGELNMLAQQFARGGNVALPAQFQKPVVFFVGPFHAMRQVQLQASVAFAAVVDVPDRRHETRLVGFGVQRGVEFPVQSSPTGNVIVVAELVHEGFQDRFRVRKIFLGKVRNRAPQNLRFEQGADGKEFFDIIRGKCRDNCPAVGNNGD